MNIIIIIRKNISKIIGAIKKFQTRKTTNIILAIVSAFVMPMFFLWVSEFVETRMFGRFISYYFARFSQALIGYVPLVLLFGLLLLLSRRPWVPALILGVVNVMLRYANYYKTIYLATPILASDISLIGDAVKITEYYSAPFYKHAWAGLLLVFLTVLVLMPIRLPKFKAWKKEFVYRTASSFAVMVLIFTFFTGVVYNAEARSVLGYYYNPARLIGEYEDNTFYSSLFVNSQSLFPQKPNGYSAIAVDEIVGELAAMNTSGSKTPDVIVVMAESWEFLEEFEDVSFSENLHENYDRLKSECITGNMVSSQRGGGTAQIEFEMLTGLSTDRDILPFNAFNSYTYKGMPCYPNFLDNYGYNKYVLHPYSFNLYNRPTVYSNFGVDNIYSQDDFNYPEHYGLFTSDVAAVDKTIEIYEDAVQQGAPVFLQLITMQNHGPFYVDNLDASERLVKVENAGGLIGDEIEILENVASQMYKTDQAIGKLLDYFHERTDRDVIIIAFGDHQTFILPSIGDENLPPELLARTDFYDTHSEYDAAIKTHLTPYLMWCNYQTPSVDSFGYLAPSMLLPVALAEFGAVRPAYFDWLLKESMQSEVNSRSGDFIIRADGTIAYPATDNTIQHLLRRYILEYQIIFEKGENINEWLY